VLPPIIVTYKDTLPGVAIRQKHGVIPGQSHLNCSQEAPRLIADSASQDRFVTGHDFSRADQQAIGIGPLGPVGWFLRVDQASGSIASHCVDDER
jgi:hypothetical protein